jgi:hypothetical protein
MLLGNGAGGPQALHVAREHSQGLAEGVIRIAGAGVGVAAAEGGQELAVSLHGLAHELAQEHGLAGAWPADDEGGTPVALERQLQATFELAQLLLARHEEGWRGVGIRRVSGEETGGRRAWKMVRPQRLCAGADALVKVQGLGGRRAPELLQQGTPASIELR